MADYGAWAGIGQGISRGVDAYRQAKLARLAQEKEAKQEARQAEMDAITKAENTPTYDAPPMLNAPGLKLTRGEYAGVASKIAENAAKGKGGTGAGSDLKRLPTTGINMQDLSSFPTDIASLDSLAGDIEANKDIVGPISGRLAKGAAFLPTAMQPESAVRLQELQSRVDNLKQTIGKFKEGGVLRKEDEDKYNRILATIWDNPTVAAEKLRNIRKEMTSKYNATLDTLGAQGYKTAGLSRIGGSASAPKAASAAPAGGAKRYTIVSVE